MQLVVPSAVRAAVAAAINMRRFRAPWQGAAIMQGYTPIQLVVPSAVRMAVITDAIICSVHFKVSRFVIICPLSYFWFYIIVIRMPPVSSRA